MTREIAYGNTFGGWALPSYGGFWIGLGIIFTPGGFDIAAAYGGQTEAFYKALGFYIFGWFIVCLSLRGASFSVDRALIRIPVYFLGLAHDSKVDCSLQLFVSLRLADVPHAWYCIYRHHYYCWRHLPQW